jgi:hypothetical protein
MKKVQILIITLVSLLTLAGISFAILFFATDTFKSDRDMFYTYISQMNINELVEGRTQNNYQERLKSESYTNEGTIALKYKEDGMTIIDDAFNYNSKVDPINKLASSDVSVNKSGEEILKVNYLRNEDLYGIKFEEIVNQYVIFENSNLKEFAKKIGIPDTINIPDRIDLNENMGKFELVEIDLEGIKPIYEKYINIVLESIPEEAYSKIEDGYKLTIDLKTVQKILVNVLNTLKDDQEIFDLIDSVISKIDSSQSLSFEEYQTALEVALEEISMDIEENYNLLDITVNKDGKINIKMQLEGETNLEVIIEKKEDEIILNIDVVKEGLYTNSEINISISKKINVIENDECTIMAVLKEDESEVGNINIKTSRHGKLDSTNIKNSMVATIIIPDEDLEINANYNNDKTFTPNLEIEKINKDNNLVINNLDVEQMQNLATNLGNLIKEKTNTNVAEILGTVGIGFASTVHMEAQEMAVIGGVTVGTSITILTVKSSQLFETASQAVQETQLNMNNQMVQTFNSNFTAYQGTKRGAEIKGLWNIVNASNSTNFDHIVTITGVSMEEIDASKTYNVSTRKNEEGYINQIIIEENDQQETTLNYTPVMPGDISSETQSLNQSAMSQIFSEGQEFLNN